ncbi:MAG: hypothetical protein WKF77_15860 [Planctomycetaceae bacterium]
MNPLERNPWTTIGKSNFSPITVGGRTQLLEWWRSIADDHWHDTATSGKHSMLLQWLSERGLITTRIEAQWYPPTRPPFCVSVVMEQSGPFQYLRFLEAFGGLHCVLPEWRDSLRGADWQVPAVTHFKSNRNAIDAQTRISEIESAAKFRGERGVMTGEERAGKAGRSLEEAIANVKGLGFKDTKILSVKFDGSPVYGKEQLPASPSFIDTLRKTQWRARFRWSETTFRERQTEFPQAFNAGTTVQVCSIRSDFVSRWDAEAATLAPKKQRRRAPKRKL